VLTKDVAGCIVPSNLSRVRSFFEIAHDWQAEFLPFVVLLLGYPGERVEIWSSPAVWPPHLASAWVHYHLHGPRFLEHIPTLADGHTCLQMVRRRQAGSPRAASALH
jgi:hypothetical protein